MAMSNTDTAKDSSDAAIFNTKTKPPRAGGRAYVRAAAAACASSIDAAS